MIRVRVAVLPVVLLAGAVAGQPPREPKAPPDLAAVPRDGFAVVTVKLSAAWDLPALQSFRDWAAGQPDGTLEPLLGVGPADLDRVTVFWPTYDGGEAGSPLVLTATRQPYDEARVVRNLLGPGAEDGRVVRSGPVLHLPRGGWLTFASDTVRVMNPGLDGAGGPGRVRSATVAGQLLAPRADGPLAPALAAAGDHLLAAGVDVTPFARLVGPESAPELAPYAALLAARTATVTADITDAGQVRVVLTLAFADAAAATKAGPVAWKALADLARRVGASADRYAAQRDAETGVVMFGWMRDGLKAATVEVKGAAVVATAMAPLEPFLGRFVATFPKRARVQRGITEAENNLKQIVFGLHNFESAYLRLPSDIGPNGKAIWSWRVQLLPYLGQEALHHRLDFKLAWDDPKNKAVLASAAMPTEFELPGRPAPKGHTYFRSFSSPKGAAAGGRAWLTAGEWGPRIATITDGTTNTFAVVEAGESVPWYVPDVFPYEPMKPLPQLGAKDAQTFLAVMGSGEVRVIPRATDEKVLRALITRDGGEVVDLPGK